MAEETPKMPALSAGVAYQLADVIITAPQFESITPRWLMKILEWKALENGIFRRNRVKEGETPLDVLFNQEDNLDIPEGFVDYEAKPREYILSSISTIINIHTRVSDLYNRPYDQSKEQLRLGMESLKERQESELINNDDYGLLKNIVPTQRIKTRHGYPTPDDLDELITRVWKEPSYFLAHPRAIAAFGRECTRRGVPPMAVTMFGAPFMTWRGIPIIPTDKLFVDGQKRPQGHEGKTNILLMRVGEQKQGVLGLYQSGVPGEQARGLSVRFMGINGNGIGSYLLSLYCSVAILTDDAIAVLEEVEVGHYYDYN